MSEMVEQVNESLYKDAVNVTDLLTRTEKILDNLLGLRHEPAQQEPPEPPDGSIDELERVMGTAMEQALSILTHIEVVARRIRIADQGSG